MNDNRNAVQHMPLPPTERSDEERNRTLLKLVKLAHAMSDSERELALAMLQAMRAWGGLTDAA